MQDNERYQVIGTKVSAKAYRLLNRLAKSKGLTVYEMMQMCADTLVRYMSDSHNLTPDMEQAMGLFEHMIGWAGALNLCDPGAKPRIAEATYYLTAEGKRGSRAIHVNRPYFGDWQQTENIQTVVERTLELATPERYRRLRALAVETDCKSILDLLDFMLDSYDAGRLDTDEIRRGFEDCARAENNKPYEYGRRTRRTKAYTPDTQPAIHFKPEDVPDLPELQGEEAGGHRHPVGDERPPFDPDRDAIGI